MLGHALSFLDALDLMSACVTSARMAALVPRYVSHATSLHLAKQPKGVPEPFPGAIRSAFSLVCDRAGALRRLVLQDWRSTPNGMSGIKLFSRIQLVELIGRCKATLQVARLHRDLHTYAMWDALADCPNLQSLWFPDALSTAGHFLDSMAKLVRVATRVQHVVVRGKGRRQLVALLLEKLDPRSVRTIRIGRLHEKSALHLARFTGCRHLEIRMCHTPAAGFLALEAVERLFKLRTLRVGLRLMSDSERIWNMPLSLHMLHIDGFVGSHVDEFRIRAPGLSTFKTGMVSERTIATILGGAPLLANLECEWMTGCTPDNRVLADAIRNAAALPMDTFHIRVADSPVAESVVLAIVETFRGLGSLHLCTSRAQSGATTVRALCLLGRLRDVALVAENAEWDRSTCVEYCRNHSARKPWSAPDIRRELGAPSGHDTHAAAGSVGLMDARPRRKDGKEEPAEERAEEWAEGAKWTEGTQERDLASVTLSVFDASMLGFLAAGVRRLHVVDYQSADIDLAVVFRALPNLDALILRTGRGARCSPASSPHIPSPASPSTSDGGVDSAATIVAHPLRSLTLDCLDGGFVGLLHVGRWCPRATALFFAGVDTREFAAWLLSAPAALCDLTRLVTANCDGSVPPEVDSVAGLRALRPGLECQIMDSNEFDDLVLF